MLPDGVILVSFGVADEAARRQSIDAIFGDMKEAFAPQAMRQAFTSNFIRKRLAARGEIVPSLDEALDAFHLEGKRRVLVQPTHLTAGEEYEKKICAAIRAHETQFDALVLGATLLESEVDYARLLEVLAREMPLRAGQELVLMGHGSPHQHNPVYERLQAYLDAAGAQIHVGVLEESDTPSFSDVLERLQARGVHKIVLAPLLLSGGSHVLDDMAGEAEDSWKSRFARAGIGVSPIRKGLGEYAAIRRMYVKKAQRAWERET